MLQALVKIYYSEISEYSCKRDESFTEDLVGELQTSVIEMIRAMLDAETSAYRVDVSYLLSVLYMVDDADIVLPILQLFYDFMMSSTPKTNLFQSMSLCKAHTVFLKCFCNEVDEVRCLAIQCLQCFWTALSPAARLATGINEFTPDECSGIADFLADNSVTLGVYQSLMDFTLSLKPGSVAKGCVDGRRPLAIQNPFAFNILIEALCSAKDARMEKRPRSPAVACRRLPEIDRARALTACV